MPRSNDGFPDYALSCRTAAEPLSIGETLGGDLNCDACVVGGGFTGLSSALHLATSGREVVLLERGRIGWGASGRNAGMILPGFASDMADVRREVGEQHARRLWFLSVEAVALVAELQRQYDIGCDFKAGHLTAAVSERDLEDAQAVAADLRKAYGYANLRNVALSEIREMLASDRYVGGVLDSGAGHLDPLRLVKGLASALRSLGVRIFEQTPVISVHFDDNSAGAATETGRVRARHLVLATNAAVGELVSHIKRRIFRAHSFMVATAPLESAAHALIRDDIAVNDTKLILDYFRLSSSSRLLFGGGLSIFKPPSHRIRSSIRRRMLKVFPQLAETPIDHAWSGVIDITANRLPDIGRLSRSAYYAQGFSGHGIALSLAAGRLIAESITGCDERFEILETIPHRNYVGISHSLKAAGEMLWPKPRIW